MASCFALDSPELIHLTARNLYSLTNNSLSTYTPIYSPPHSILSGLLDYTCKSEHTLFVLLCLTYLAYCHQNPFLLSQGQFLLIFYETDHCLKGHMHSLGLRCLLAANASKVGWKADRIVDDLLMLWDNWENNWIHLGLPDPKSIEMTFRLIALNFLKVKGAIEMSKCEHCYYIFCYQPIALPPMTNSKIGIKLRSSSIFKLWIKKK